MALLGLAALGLLVATFRAVRLQPARAGAEGDGRAAETRSAAPQDAGRGVLVPARPVREAGGRRALPAQEGELPWLRVRVVTAEGGDPLTGVVVRAYQRGTEASEPRWEGESSTDSDGSASLRPTHPMSLSVVVRRTADHGGAAETVEFPMPHPDEPILIAVPTALDTHWYLRILSKGQPVPGASVRVLHMDDNGQPHDHVETTSDDAGLARVDAWSWKTAQARIRAGAHGLSIVASTEGHDTPASAQLVELWPAADLIATVVDGGGAAVPGAVVRLAANTAVVAPASSGPVRMAYWNFEAITQVDGRATIENLPAEIGLAYSIELDGLHAQEGLLTLAASKVQERRFVLSFDGVVLARVVDERGEPLSGLDVWLVRNPHANDSRVLLQEHHRSKDPLASTTDIAGNARFEGVPAGHWHLGVADFTGERTSCAQPIVLTPESPVAEALLVHQPARWVAGSIVDKDGTGVRGANLSVYGGSELGGLLGRSDAKGAFRVGPLPAGTYRLDLYQAPDRFLVPEPRDVQAGDTELLIVLAEGGHVTGTVRDLASGRAAPGCYLAAFAYESPRPNVGLSRSFSDDGAFQMQGLPASAVAILARHDDGRVGYVRGLRPDPDRALDEVVVEIQPGVPLRFRYQGPAATGTVLLTMEGVTLGYYSIRRGASELITVPPGRLDVLTTADGQEPLRSTFEFAPGAAPHELIVGEPR